MERKNTNQKKNPNFRQKSKTKFKEALPMMKEALDYIKEGKKNFDELHLKENNPVLYSKMIILETKIRCSLEKNSEMSTSLHDELKQACEVMKEKNLFYLEIIALQTMAEYMIT